MNNPTNGGPQPQAAAPDSGPQVNVLAQYIKDLSFENPNAPHSLQPSQQPSINLQINVGAQPMGETDVEVSIRVDGKAETQGGVMFAFELVYAGIFRIQNAPQDVMGALVMIECPRLLFPFVRELISSITRNGGFPPLMIDPVDFVALYRQRMAQGESGAPAQA